MPKLSNRARLMAGGALAAFAIGGYAPRGAYAGSCQGPEFDIVCTGAADPAGGDVTQVLYAEYGDLNVRTDPGFGIDTRSSAVATAISLDQRTTGPADIAFTDANGSVIAGGLDGISANAPIGSVEITATGDVIGVNGSGVDVIQTGNATLTLNNVTAYEDAISVTASGSIEIDVSGTIRSYDGDGVNAMNGAGAIDVTVGAVTAYGDGLDLDASAGPVIVNATGTVSSDAGYGVNAIVRNGEGALTINAVDVDGYYGAIAAETDDGAISITLTGTATSDVSDAIYASSSNGSIFVSVATAAVAGGDGDHEAIGDGGDGDREAIGDGVDATTYTGDITVNVGDATGTDEGVFASTYEGNVSITVTGTAIGMDDDGIDAFSEYGDVYVDAFNVQGADDGIEASTYRYSSGAVSIYSSGTITADDKGVNADSGYGDLRIVVNDATGGEDGVEAYSYRGNVSITILGTATGEENDGVDAASHDGNVSVNAVNVIGGDEGIEAEVYAYGNGTISVYSSGTVTGGDTGILTSAGYGNTYITANNVSGVEFGIAAEAYDGDIQITANGTVTASSGTAIYARTYGDGYQRSVLGPLGNVYTYGGSIIAVNGDVQGTLNGIEFVKDQYTYGADAAPGGEVSGGQVSITVNGNVRGGAGAGILVRQVDNGPGGYDEYSYSQPFFAGIDVNGAISAESGKAIDARTVRTSLRINEGAEITGDVLLGAYGDSVSLNSATLTADARIFAGENPEGEGQMMRFIPRDDSLSVTGDTSVVASNLYDFNQLFVGEYATLTVADVDTITLEPTSFRGIRLVMGEAAETEEALRLRVRSELTVYGGELVTGTDLTINAYQGVAIRNGYAYSFDSSSSTTIRTLRTPGQLTIGGTPGQSRVEMNFEAPGDYGTFYNAGRINMANGGAGDDIVVNGRFINTGDISVDISPELGADAITARGDVFIAGQIDVNVIDANQLGRTEHVVVSSTSGTVTEGLAVEEELEGDLLRAGVLEVGEVRETPETLTAVTDSVVADVDVRVEETEVIVGVDVNFVPEVEEPEGPEEPEDPNALEEDPQTPGTDGLSDNARVIGETLNATIDDRDLATLRQAALNATSIEELEALYIALGGADFAATISAAQAMGLTFGQGLFSCNVGTGAFAAIDEGQCGYTRIGGTYADVDADPGEPGFDATTFDLAFGGQIELDENLRLGGSIGYNRIDGDGDAGLDFGADRIAAGISIKYVEGPFVAGLSLSGGYSFADTERTIAGFGVADAEFDGFDFSAIARAAYLFDAGGGFYVKPQIEAGVTHVDRDGFSETGAGAANLVVASESETFFTLSPSVEIGGDFELEGGMKARPFVRVGATFIGGESIETTASFAGAAAQPFTTTVSRDDLFGDVAAGVAFFSGDELAVRAEYQGRFSEDAMSHGGFLKVQIRF